MSLFTACLLIALAVYVACSVIVTARAVLRPPAIKTDYQITLIKPDGSVEPFTTSDPLKFQDGVQSVLNEHAKQITGLANQRNCLEAELKARKETDAEMSAELARTFKEREEARAEAEKLGRMNESIEKRLTDQVVIYSKANSNLIGLLADALGVNAKVLGDLLYHGSVAERIASLRDKVEKRVHDGYSKGYALGQADAFERVRQVFPVDAA